MSITFEIVFFLKYKIEDNKVYYVFENVGLIRITKDNFNLNKKYFSIKQKLLL